METMFITGYSYKGGVGRSTALANIACLLAEDSKHPQKVLLWDFDLEAPGMHRLFPAKDAWRSGFVDLAYEFASSGELSDPSDYVYRSIVPGIDVLPAGLVDESYCDKLARIDWPSFFGDDPKERGPFFDPLVTWMKEVAEYDYVLIDSRTGLSDVAGICTQVLPDVLMILFRLTEQNLDGVSHLVPVIREQLASRGRTEVKVLPIVSSVLSQSSETVNELRVAASEVFAEKHLKYIRFDPDLIAEERLFCLESVRSELWPEPPIVGDYKRLSSVLRRLNPQDTWTLFQDLRRQMHETDFATARRIVTGLIKRRPHLPDVWRHLRTICRRTPDGFDVGDELADELQASGEANIYLLDWQAAKHAAKATSPTSKELTSSVRCLQEAAEIAPNRPSVYRHLTEIASCTGDLDLATSSSERLHELATDNFQSALDLANLYIRRGRDYFMLAKKTLSHYAKVVQSPLLVYLSSFFGDEFEAGRAFEDMKQSSTPWMDEQFLRLVRIYSTYLLGNLDEAKATAEDAIAEFREDSEFEVGNWAECFLCMSEFKRAVSLLEEHKSKITDEDELSRLETYDGLSALAKYLDPLTDEMEEEEIVDTWTTTSWNFTELLLFREHVLKEEEYSKVERLDVIERLIQMCSLVGDKGDESIFWRRASARPHVLIQRVGRVGRMKFVQ